jgi:hypothetical protein
VAAHGDRTTYYVFADSAMEQRMAVGVQSAVAFKRLVQRGLDALPQRDPARHHLDKSLEWSEVLIDSLDQALQRWRAGSRAASRPRLAAKGV